MIAPARRTVAVAAILLLLGLSLIYGLFEARRFLQGPVLSIQSPLPGARISSVVYLSGRAQNISFITLNGRQIYVDDEGYFKETLTPSQGYTVLTVEVRDRFGRTDRKSLPVVIE
jgi:hypothetical protein